MWMRMKFSVVGLLVAVLLSLEIAQIFIYVPISVDSIELKCKKQFLHGEILKMMISIEFLNLFCQTQVN
jgi:hypothetical protein